MPNPVVQPLFDRARELKVGFHMGYAEPTPEGRRFNAAIASGGTGQSWASTARHICRARSSRSGVDAIYALQSVCPP